MDYMLGSLCNIYVASTCVQITYLIRPKGEERLNRPKKTTSGKLLRNSCQGMFIKGKLYIRNREKLL